MKYTLFFLLVSIVEISFGQKNYFPEKRVDVEKYQINIDLSKYEQHIVVVEEIEFLKKKGIDTLVLDLYALDTLSGGNGMVVHKASTGNQKLNFSQNGHLLFVMGWNLDLEYSSLKLEFEGTPLDGLIIGNNKYHEKTIFGDNWPNRAHHWFACNDYPSDKSTVDFSVSAPGKYEVIANGELVEVNDFVIGQRTWTYKTEYELPTKVMVIGVADFSVKEFGPVNDQGTPVSAWVYPQDEEKGIYDMSIAPAILSWFEKKIAPYPFDKLANVQSTTRYGGMENASCIFYDEKAIDGKRSMENLIAHEIAHQWFGNSASEKNFSHLWLSEGFATYLTNIYILETKGEEAFYKQMDKDRAKVVGFDRKISLPVIDTLTTDLNQLLNANAYQKGSWILHMLRMKLGDEVFWKAVRNYYSAFEYGNADSKDLEQIFESTCACDLTAFFDQWLRTAGNPSIKLKVKAKRKSAIVYLEQLQKDQFDLELEIEFIGENGHSHSELIHLNKKVVKSKLVLPFKVKSYRIDPLRKVLIEVK
jgi:aminopeptidase N